MTTPEAPAPGQPGKPASPRVRRAPPARSGPNRASSPEPAAQPASQGPASPTDAGPPPNTAAPISEAVANAVQLGYRVIGENIQQGREAAQQFREGQYNVRDVPRDLSQMTLRLLDLAREFSTATYDVLERVLRDPNLVGALQPKADGQPAAGASKRNFAPPSFYPTPGTPPSSTPAPPSSTAAPPAVSAEVKLTVKFIATKPAVVKAAALIRPSAPTPLTVTALTSLQSSLPPITDVTFSAAADGVGVVANITLSDDQPAGLYSGVICALDTQTALGILTIEVSD